MSNQLDVPKLGATFVPGGFDDFHIPAPSPDVMSPAPQRLMQEVPGQMQDGIAHLELDGISKNDVGPSQQYNRQATGQASSQRYNEQQYGPPAPINNTNSRIDTANHLEAFSSAMFPNVQRRTSNVPPSDEEREMTLENARMTILSSTDPEMQLAWAQDALAYVGVSVELEQRLSYLQSPRPSTPQLEYQIRIDAMNIVMFLADQQHPKAEFFKGMWLEFGRFGARQDKPEAFRCYKRAAAKGYARAEYRMGMQFESTNELVKALQHYKAGADLGDSASCYVRTTRSHRHLRAVLRSDANCAKRMGMMALLGQLGQPQDFRSGVALVRKAADTADENAPQGAYVYGMLLAGELPQINVPELFLPADLASAKTYIEKAAYLGFSKAQLKMGSAYELCMLGCDFNPGLSLHYNALAARQGEAEAEMSVSKWMICGCEGVFPKNEGLAYRFAQRAAYGGLPMAEFALGYFHEIGMHVPVDLAKAQEWYKKAAKNGNNDAAGRIQAILKSKPLSKTDHEDVAISRIKSQHGSRRGARPERFTKLVQPMPTLLDESGQHQSEIVPGGPHTMSNPQRPPVTMTPPSQQQRAPSITPYPIENRPATVMPYPVDDRPITVAAYPNNQEASAGQRLGPAGGFLAVDQRLSSTAVNGGWQSGMHLEPQHRPYPNGPREQTPPLLRTYFNPPDAGQSGRGQGPATNLVRTGGQAFPRPADDYRRPSGTHNRITSTPLPYAGRSPRGSLDMESSASLTSRQDPINRPQKPGESTRPRPEARHPSQSSLQSGPRHGTGPTAGQGPTISQPSPIRNSELRASSRPASDGRSYRQTPPPPSVMSGGLLAGSSATKVQASSHALDKTNEPEKLAPLMRPPGKGPQTFEEMGVPQGKQDNDCIIM